MSSIQVSIFVGTVYGNAQHAAEQALEALTEIGIQGQIIDDPDISSFKQASSVLVITSTTGQGDIPDNLFGLFCQLRDQFPLMEQKPFAVAGLGDSSYGDTFCGAGKQWFELLTELQGKPVAELLIIDACETLEPEKEVVPWVEGLAGALTDQ